MMWLLTWPHYLLPAPPRIVCHHTTLPLPPLQFYAVHSVPTISLSPFVHACCQFYTHGWTGQDWGGTYHQATSHCTPACLPASPLQSILMQFPASSLPAHTAFYCNTALPPPPHLLRVPVPTTMLLQKLPYTHHLQTGLPASWPFFTCPSWLLGIWFYHHLPPLIGGKASLYCVFLCHHHLSYLYHLVSNPYRFWSHWSLC